jgi:hypothetical protein
MVILPNPYHFGRARLRRAVTFLFLLPFSFLIQNAPAQIQQAWVASYNNGILNGTNQAVKMTLDSVGNIYITGFSENTNTKLGYVTIKYAPNGNQLWTSRYDSTNSLSATPAAMALDNSNDLIVTGTAVTVKYDSNGNQLWTAPYAGTALAVDTNGNIAVTGFDTMFSTVKLGPSGSNLRQESYPAPCGAATAQLIIAATNGSFYVVGNYPFYCERGLPDYELFVIKYTVSGSQAWTTNYQVEGGAPVQVEGGAVDGTGSVYFVVNFEANTEPSTLVKYSMSGSLQWAALSPNANCGRNGPHMLAIDSSNNVIMAG